MLFSEEQVEQVAEAVNRVRTTAKVAILTVISTATPCTEVFPAFCASTKLPAMTRACVYTFYI